MLVIATWKHRGRARKRKSMNPTVLSKDAMSHARSFSTQVRTTSSAIAPSNFHKSQTLLSISPPARVGRKQLLAIPPSFSLFVQEDQSR
uniref:Uncharacterized protein n=1 Tax=Hyaloperonospora arabidopsidis (strain Emoy2) TaxID=559515 RepID=M4BLZ1_HYAAE